MEVRSFLHFNFMPFIFLFFLSYQATAQRFSIGIIGGINVAEFSNPDFSNYIGLNTGLKGTLNLGKTWSCSTEFLYSQAGEYVAPIAYASSNIDQIRLDFLEIPFYFSKLAFPKDHYFQKQFSIGFSFVKLINHKIKDDSGKDISDQTIWKQKENVAGHLGVSHYFDPNIELNFRAALSKNEIAWIWTLSLRGIYNL